LFNRTQIVVSQQSVRLTIEERRIDEQQIHGVNYATR
jgi:hypothetical protein